MRRHLVHGVASTLLLGCLTVMTAAPAVGQGSLILQGLKLFGIGFVVKTYGKQINSFVNTLMLNNAAQNREATKVVPILSVGVGIVSGNPGSYIGAAQVQGPQAALDRVQAVAQIEGDFFSALRVKGLVPVDGLNPIPGHLHRVYGVGVTAIIDFRL